MEGNINHSLLSTEYVKPRSKPFQIHDTKLKGFILRIQPSGSMTYYFEYRSRAGKRSRIKIGTTKQTNPTVARDCAKEHSAKVVMGFDPAEVEREARANTCTLKQYLDEHYAPWIAREQRFRTGKATISRIRSVFKELLDKPITEPNFAWRIEEFRTARLKDGIKKATIDREIGALKAMFSHAVRNPEIKFSENPLKDIKPLRKSEHDDEGDERVRYLGQYDPEERKRFWSAVDAREKRIRDERRRYNLWRSERGLEPYPDLDRLPYADYLKPMIIIALYTGLRRKELFLSEWANFKPHLSEPKLTVPGKIAKSKRTRHVVLGKRALSTLLAWRKQTRAIGGLIFPSQDGNVRDNIRKAWQRLLADAGITDFRWHDMRHDFASRLAMKGMDSNKIRELLGHRDIKTTLRYAHLSPTSLAQAISKLDDDPDFEAATANSPTAHRGEAIR